MWALPPLRFGLPGVVPADETLERAPGRVSSMIPEPGRMLLASVELRCMCGEGEAMFCRKLVEGGG